MNRRCGYAAAHPPHRPPDTGDGCPGIMPIWPCDRTHTEGTHYAHSVGVYFYCPGSVNPPDATIGPQYPDSMIPPEPAAVKGV
jgi:hypothetical protein